jgi:hypothetical protein
LKKTVVAAVSFVPAQKFVLLFLSMIAEVANQMDLIQNLCAQYKVKSMHLFGSAVGDDFSASSDLDFLVDFQAISPEEYTDNYFALRYALEKIFERKVDLVTQNSLRNPILIQNIEDHKLLLYAA